MDPNSTPSPEWSASDPIDQDDLELQLQQELRGMFDVDTQQYLQTYANLVEQLQAVSWTADIQELFRNVHTIKGGAVTVGADGILYVATVLEDLLGDLRHLNPAPPLEDGQLGQLLLEAGELLASSLSVWETGEAAQKVVQPAIDRIQSLRIYIQQVYLPNLTDQKRLHQEFAEQGFDLVVLDFELGLEHLPSQGSIPNEVMDSARQTLAQLAEIGHDLEFDRAWSALLGASEALFDLQSVAIWRSHWPIYLQAFKASAYAGGVAIECQLPEVSSLEIDNNEPILSSENETESSFAENPELNWDFDDFDLDIATTDDFTELSNDLDDFELSQALETFDIDDILEDHILENSILETSDLETNDLEKNDLETSDLDLNDLDLYENEFEKTQSLQILNIDDLEFSSLGLDTAALDESFFSDEIESPSILAELDNELTELAPEASQISITPISLDQKSLDQKSLEVTDDWLDLISLPVNESDILEIKLLEPKLPEPKLTEPIVQTAVNESATPRPRTELSDIQIPIPLGRLDQTAQYLVDALLTARSTQGLHRALQEQLSQLFAIAKESTEYITRLRQLQDDYALLDAIKSGSNSEIESGKIPLERYRQGYSTINRLLENSLRLSEVGLEAEKKFLQTNRNLQQLEQNMLQLQQTVEQSRLVPFTKLAFRARAILRDLTNRLGKPAQLVVQGEHLDLDAGTLSKLEPLLLHLIRNAFDHGFEPSADRVAQGKSKQATLVLSLQRRGNRFVLDITDDGRGIDPALISRIAQSKGLPLTQTQTSAELLAVICQPGFSSQNVVTDVSGRGIGMDVVIEQVASLGGTLTLDTKTGQGTTFRLQFPVPHLLVPCVLLRAGDRTFAVPTDDIATTNILANLAATPIANPTGRHTWQIQQGEFIEPGIEFLDYWNIGKTSRTLDETAVALAIRSSDSSARIWILADEIIDKTDLLIKPLPTPMIAPIGLLGLSLQPDGDLIPVIETAALAECLRANILTVEDESAPHSESDNSHEQNNAKTDTKRTEQQSRSILVVDDAALMRRRIEASLTASGYKVTTCNDGLDAWNWLQANPLPGLVITDIEMPNMDGFTLINHCRQADISIPMLVVSSRLAEEWYKEAQRLGASGYLTKGFSTSDLLDRVKSLMDENQPEALHL